MAAGNARGAVGRVPALELLGVSPTISVNRALNEPRLEYRTA
jgi:hypothetical protein